MTTDKVVTIRPFYGTALQGDYFHKCVSKVFDKYSKQPVTRNVLLEMRREALEQIALGFALAGEPDDKIDWARIERTLDSSIRIVFSVDLGGDHGST